MSHTDRCARREDVLARDATRSLDGEWTFRTDPEDSGVADGWHQPGAEWAAARTVEVPFAWQEAADLRSYTGVAWYRRTFEAPAFDERLRLRFGAVDYEATVWVNGTEVGSHTEGYLPFGLDITDAVEPGENTVAVRVRDPEDVSELPHGKQSDGWYTAVSGIWQSVDLLAVPETRVLAARATPDLDVDAARFDVETNVEAADGTEVAVEVTRAGTTVARETASVGGDGRTALTVGLDDPDYWTPADPTLYDFTVELRRDGERLDTFEDSFGMRSVAVEDGDLLLNGEPFRMRGALDQAYYPEGLYRPESPEMFAEEVRLAKELGFNTLRKHIKVPHPEFLRQADEQGILVWAEPANPTVYTERSKRALRDQFEGMVARDYNRPSVVAWSLYNEEWGIGLDQRDYSDHPGRLGNDAEKQAYLAAFVADARELDPTRLLCDNSGWAHVETDINDYHEYFVSPDRAGAWRERLDHLIANPAENYATTDYDDPESALTLLSEFGTWGLPKVSSLRERAGGDPHWFAHEFLDGLKRPAGVDERFESSVLTEFFADLDALSEAWCRRELASVEDVIRTVRTREGVPGYVLTEFSDIEWEFNGVLDYHREPKEGLTGPFADANAPVTAWAEPVERALWAGETARADLVVVNDERTATTVTVEWEAFGESGTREVSVGATGTVRVEDAIVAPTPAADAPTSASVTVSLPERGVSTTSELTVAPNMKPPDATLAVADADLASALDARGYEVTDAAAADLTIYRGDGAAAATGPALLLPDADGHFDAPDSVSLTPLAEEESWNLCASVLVQRLFEGLDTVPGWAFDRFYPYSYVDDVGADDAVDVAYAEGWLGSTGAALLTRETDNGSLGVCTLRVADSYGEHPVATVLLDRLVGRLTGSNT